MIYYLLDAGRREIKIGATINIFARMSCLKAGAIGRLSLLGCQDGYKNQELVLHALWIKYKMRGEWFRVNRKLLKFIKDNSKLSCLTQYERFKKFHADKDIFQYLYNRYAFGEDKAMIKRLTGRTRQMSLYEHVDYLLENPSKTWYLDAPADAGERETLTLGIE